MNKNFRDFIFLQKIIIALLNNNLFFIFLIFITILYSYYIDLKIGAFIFVAIFILYCFINQYSYITLHIFFPILITTIFIYIFL